MQFVKGLPPNDDEFDPILEDWCIFPKTKNRVLYIIIYSLLFAVLGFLLYKTGKPVGILFSGIIIVVSILLHEVAHAVCFPDFGFSNKTTIGYSPNNKIIYAHYRGILSKKRL